MVAYALAGRMDVDLTTEAARQRHRGQAGLPERYLADAAGNRNHRARGRHHRAIQQSNTAKCSKATRTGSPCPFPQGDIYKWDPKSTYIKLPPYFENMPKTPPALADIHGARVLAILGDSVTTDHISPAGSIPVDSPAGKYLDRQRREAA